MVLEFIREEKEKFEKNKEKYLESISKVARKYGIKAYVFGSRIKNQSISSSDLDILLVIPKNLWKERWKIYDEVKRACEDNIFVEIHIVSEEVFEEMKNIYGKLVKL